MTDRLVSVENLKTYFPLSEGTVRAVDGVSFDIRRGEAIGIVGESGCGKSVTAYSMLQVVQWPGRIVDGRILYYPKPGEKAVDIASLDPQGEAVRAIRGAEISMIFQEPLSAFSPLYSIGNQITEAMYLHRPGITEKEARGDAIRLLQEVGIPSPEKRIDSYPFQLSGGMRQRAMIAMALSCKPNLLIADEPTTAIDVTIQAQILELLKRLQRDLGMAIMLITHDLGVIAEICTRVVVMYLGEIVEIGSMKDVYNNPLHPYTQALMESIPQIGNRRDRLRTIPGTIPDPFSRPRGCNFEPRCTRCDEVPSRPQGMKPALVEVAPEHFVRCFLYTERVKEFEESHATV